MGRVAFDDRLYTLKGIGQKRSELFEKLGIYTVADLITNYPRTYEDWTDYRHTIGECDLNEINLFKVKVYSSVKEQHVRNNMVLYKFTCIDEEQTPIIVTLFNNRFLAAKISVDAELILRGKIEFTGKYYTTSSPNILPIQQAGIIPVYSQTKGLSSYNIGAAVSQILPELSNIYVNDPLPLYIKEKYDLCDICFAIEQIHKPDTFKQLNIASTRLIFEELLMLQLGMYMFKNNCSDELGIAMNKNCLNEFLPLLPYTLTSGQLSAVCDSINDMTAKKNASPTAMNRLIQGDVGSGKTAVACAVAHTVIKNGYQAALMAPTEILAEQHYLSISKLMSSCNISVALLTGSTKAAVKKDILSKLAAGNIDFIIGTHSLIEDTVEFAHLALVITDEQHRFGVKQRSRLAAKADNPHMLVMSATPIPRTLALIVYGDLDISIINELPAGRKPIKTMCINSSTRLRAYNFIKKNVDSGRQCYIVCPLVEDGVLDLLNVNTLYDELSNGFFSKYSMGLLHGKMKSSAKEKVMREFSAGEINILVATTVVEVGVDVANANIILIENAERYGLSQLHQLRGRVGRGEHESFCILVSDSKSQETLNRLNILKTNSSGFDIADHDLKLRGPGDFFGSRQHGLPQLKIADMLKNIDTLKMASDVAFEILRDDKNLSDPKHETLKKSVLKLFSEYANSI